MLALETLRQFIENQVNGELLKKLEEQFDDPTLAPRVLMMMVGTHVTYLPPRLEGTDVVIEYVAPVEPEPKPRQNYVGAVGRTLLEEERGHVRFDPATLGDTWAAPNLAKIDHIVVVMMENRSYDHVLGYRASATASRPADGAEGWTPELIASVSERAEAWRPPGDPGVDKPVQPMRLSKFLANGQGRLTQLPSGVGHSVVSVTQQLAGQIDGPGGRRINDPGGFIDNFREGYLKNQSRTEEGVDQFDVLRYYETDVDTTDPNTGKAVDDLPVYGFLADHYGYSDTFFCSHPGPTLPNRMYFLSGDVEHDRHGFAILENNDGDNFLLSRAPTIFDVLEREGVSWRVYESGPSVAMLRMFARYAGDNVNIRPFDELAVDFATTDQPFPSFVMVEPAMHHHPQNDDHPDADMWRGQDFIRRVYTALTGNRARFEKTLLVITYDEHGGLYDHVIPPIAEILEGQDPQIAPPVGGQGVSPALTDGGGGVGPAGEPPAPAGTRRIGQGRLRARDLGPTDAGGVVVPEMSDGAPPGRIHEASAKIQYGVRVPTFLISPLVPPGKGPSVVLDFCSILKTVLARFCPDSRPFLSDRVDIANSLDRFLSEPAPRPDPGLPPEIGPIDPGARSGIVPGTQTVTPALFRREMRDGPVESHDITGRLARLLGR